MKNKNKPLNIAKRVEIIIREGVEPTNTWIGVKGYERPSHREGDGWMEWEKLYEHHLLECDHLRSVITEMREQIINMDEQLDKFVERLHSMRSKNE